MKRSKIALASLTLLTAGVIALSGCAGGGGTTGDNGKTNGGGNASAIITVNGNEPENPLIPTNTNEVGGGKILDSVFAGLAYYDGDGKLVNDMAESITVDDPSNLTIKLKKGNKFTNDEEVTADSFINAWQYGAKFSNKQLNSSWFADIEGFDPAKDSELTGLKKVDDYTFTVKLNSPVAADWSQRLGYSAYYPLPSVAFDDMKSFGEHPIGNGPYKLASDSAWQHDIQIDLVKNDGYTGGRQVKNGGITIKFYASQDSAYADLQGGNLDVLDAIPPSAFATFESDLGDRAVNQPAAIFQSFSIPGDAAHFTGQEGELRRQAISLAINREQITKTIFNDTRTPASDFTSPVINGWSDSLAGADVLKYNADEAKKLWAEADAISKWSGSFQIAYNADGGHKEWVDAVSNSIKNTLGIDASGKSYVDFATLRADVNARKIKTAFRTGWQADYPGMYNFLQPLYSTGASSNDTDYSNKQFDALLASGASAADQDTAIADYQKAQEILLKDLPAIPLWYSNVTGGFGKGVNNVTFGWNSVPLYYEITKG
ncbi:ABC transporter substrate-binding protein [Microbacterium protaetiae]|uniref:ABC transporter substrate-binding protein n=1 Tax=Microbacterium protaetiae TaxID=2509458 RepID=A0A4P6ELA8_9MICO|nr:ABC transporter substrate-binding protein [Microbacterium protaetiae]QAY60997.1 ABC transporter substrate-binding protein [Microbacterium protaetiae]